MRTWRYEPAISRTTSYQGWEILCSVESYLDEGFPEQWKAGTNDEAVAQAIVEACNFMEQIKSVKDLTPTATREQRVAAVSLALYRHLPLSDKAAFIGALAQEPELSVI